MADWKSYRPTPLDLGGSFQEGYIGGRKKVAGRMAAEGDYTGAAQTVMPYDAEAATGYFKIGDYAEAKQRKAEDDRFAREVGGKIASGDRDAIQSAAGDAYRSGRLDQGAQLTQFVKSLDDEQAQKVAQAWSGMWADMEFLDGLSGPEQQAAYEQAKQKYAGMGLDVSRLPAQWGPNVSRGMRAQMLGPLKTIELELDERKARATEMNAESAARRADASELTALAALARAERGGEAAVGGMNSQQFSRANTLRDEFTQQTANYRTVESLADRSRKYVQTGQASPMQDIGLVYALAKVYDPTSVVREAEFATVASAGGLGARFKNLVSQAQGKGFDPKTRAELLNAIEKAAAPLREERNRISQEYARRASALGIDPQFVVDDRALAPEPPPTSGADAFDQLPNPAQYKGRTVREPATGKRYQSDGAKWIEVR